MVLKSLYSRGIDACCFANALQKYIKEVIDTYGFISVGDVLEFENEFTTLDCHEIKYTDFKYGWTSEEILYVDVIPKHVEGSRVPLYHIELVATEPKELYYLKD